MMTRTVLLPLSFLLAVSVTVSDIITFATAAAAAFSPGCSPSRNGHTRSCANRIGATSTRSGMGKEESNRSTKRLPYDVVGRRNSMSYLGSTRLNAQQGVPPENVRLLILPGFGNDADDYFLDRAPVGSLVRSLQRRGWKGVDDVKDEAEDSDDDDRQQIRVMPMRRTDWLQVFLLGALDWNFWRADAPPTGPAFSWYLNRVSNEIKDLCRDDDDRVVLICHSAGGWLGRAALGFLSAEDGDDVNVKGENESEQTPVKKDGNSVDLSKILGVVTLGAPNLPPPPGVMDMTRGALRITNEQFPGSYHKSTDGLFYITVIGKAIKGAKNNGQRQQQEQESGNRRRTPEEFAYDSYEIVCGDGTAIGDGVVPVDSAHLEDAIQLNLDGVLHSINAPESWYGTDQVIDSWHDTMLKEINRRLAEETKVSPKKAFFLQW